MALTHKRTKRKANRSKPASAAPDTRRMLKQIDTMIHELQLMRRQLTQAVPPASEAGLTERLFGAAGHGTWDEYALNLDWQRFGEWQIR